MADPTKTVNTSSYVLSHHDVTAVIYTLVNFLITNIIELFFFSVKVYFEVNLVSVNIFNNTSYYVNASIKKSLAVRNG